MRSRFSRRQSVRGYPKGQPPWELFMPMEGLVNMGVCYWMGQGVEQDRKKAVDLLEQAARLDDWGYEVLQELAQEEPENEYLQDVLRRL